MTPEQEIDLDAFKPLLAQTCPGLDAYHVVDESLLQDLMRNGASEALNRRIATHAMLARDAGVANRPTRLRDIGIFILLSNIPSASRRR